MLDFGLENLVISRWPTADSREPCDSEKLHFDYLLASHQRRFLRQIRQHPGELLLDAVHDGVGRRRAVAAAGDWNRFAHLHHYVKGSMLPQFVGKILLKPLPVIGGKKVELVLDNGM